MMTPCHCQQWQKFFFHMTLDYQAVQVLYDFHTTHGSVFDTKKVKKHYTKQRAKFYVEKTRLLVFNHYTFKSD